MYYCIRKAFKFQYDNTLSIPTTLPEPSSALFKFQYDNTLSLKLLLYYLFQCYLNSNMIIL